jgi:hypothetical protein
MDWGQRGVIFAQSDQDRKERITEVQSQLDRGMARVEDKERGEPVVGRRTLVRWLDWYRAGGLAEVLHRA